MATSASVDEASQSALRTLQQYLVLTKNEHLVSEAEYEEVLSLPYYLNYEAHYQIAYFRIDNINHLYNDEKIKDHAMLHTHLHDLIKESIPVSVEHTTLFISNHSGLILFDTAEKLRVLNICGSIIRNIAQYLDIHISVTVSDALHTFKDFLPSYEQLLKSHELRFYEGDGALIQSEEHKEFHPLNMNDLQYHVDILEAIHTKDFERIATLRKEILDYMEEHFIEPSKVLDYFIFIINNIEGNEISKGKKHALPLDQLSRRIRICETMQKLDEVLEDIFQQIEIWLKDSGSNRYRQEVLDVIDYVENHLDKRLTLGMIADYTGMSESSLSRMFKNETGKNLKYFINEKKMKKAMDILRNDTSMIKDVAASVGMDDQLYFNKVFRKFYNVSPSEIRKKRMNENEE